MKWVNPGRSTSDEDEVRTVRTGALVSGADPLPAAVAGRRDDVLEPGLLTHLTVACVIIIKCLQQIIRTKQEDRKMQINELGKRITITKTSIKGRVHVFFIRKFDVPPIRGVKPDGS